MPFLSICIAGFKAFQIVQVKLPQGAASFEEQYHGPFELLRKTAIGYKGKNPEILEEILWKLLSTFKLNLKKALPLIAVTAATAPLLGLLGTVTGMIDVFRQIAIFPIQKIVNLPEEFLKLWLPQKFGLQLQFHLSLFMLYSPEDYRESFQNLKAFLQD